MERTANSSLLITMSIVGILFGAAFHYVLMPVFGENLISCIILGSISGFINYVIALRIYKKYGAMKKSNKELKQHLNYDKLTGTLNRRAFDNDIDKLHSDSNYSMIFIDIDDFKKFNNQYGHKIGDEVLIKVAKTIQLSTRGNDMTYRYGGEEFIVILHECPKLNALTIAETIRQNIAKTDNTPYPSITASLGISTYPEDDISAQSIVEICDSALLRAKNLGKNRTCVYSSENLKDPQCL